MAMLDGLWQRHQSLLCVGLDPDLQKIPSALKSCEFPVFEFNKALIDATCDLVCAYKPQIAYYAGQGCENQLRMTMDYLRREYPHIPVILDSKRGDIGDTAEMYAREAFEHYKADAVTANPYMGGETLQPFLKNKDKGVFVLCRTSNPGAGEFQNLELQNPAGRKLYEVVAEKAASEWNANGNVGLVVGATNPDELKRVRGLVGNMPLLVPGVGAQGGDLRKILAVGRTSAGTGLVINVSRSVIYASHGHDFADAARKVAEELLRTMRDA